VTEERPRPGLRARHVHRVGPADVGQRVSVRVATPDGGARDVVGRLVSADETLLLVVSRDGQLETIEVAHVLASRVVPPHPRRPPEPEVGTEAVPLVREAARVLLLDDRDRAVLVGHLPGDGRRIWTAPGGGLHPGEDHAEAARRELREELDLEVPLGPVVWTRRVTFTFRAAWIDQAERWFLARLPGDAEAVARTAADPGTDLVRAFSLAELRSTSELLAPRAFADHLEVLLREGPPDEPMDVGR
jgi:8-oxo-dGTP pyrophosphatase MutT (NUDIX family)